MRVRANGIDIEYEDTGSGEPLLLVMGLGAQLVMWHDDFCAALARSGFRVIRFDNRDAGLSSKLQELGAPSPARVITRRMLGLPVTAPYSLDDMADDMAGLLDALKLPAAHLVGVSLGGMIAQTFALRHPERALSLTSVMSTTGSLFGMLAHPRALRALLRRAPADAVAFERWFVELFRLIGSPGFARDDAHLHRTAARSFERAIDEDGSEKLRQLGAVVASGSRSAALRSLSLPTAVIHGLSDPLILPSAGVVTARAIPGARLRLIWGMGHDLPRAIWPVLIGDIVDVAGQARKQTRRVDPTKSLSVDAAVRI